MDVPSWTTSDKLPQSASGKAIVQAASNWFNLIDKHDWNSSYALFCPFILKVLDLPSWITASAAIETQGTLVSRQLQAFNDHTTLPGLPDGQYHSLIFKSEFSQKKSTTESLVLQLDGETYHIASYTLADPPVVAPKTDDSAEKEQKAAEFCQVWLKLIDEAKFEESWKHCSKELVAAVGSAETWSQTVQDARAPLGAFKTREIITKTMFTQLPGAQAEGIYVVCVWAASFEAKLDAKEIVTPAFEDGEWKISGYYIQ